MDLKNKAEIYLIANRKEVEEHGIDAEKFKIISYESQEDLLNIIRQIIS